MTDETRKQVLRLKTEISEVLEKIKAETKAEKQAIRDEIKAIRAESKAQIKEIHKAERLFRDGKITFEQYSDVILKPNN